MTLDRFSLDGKVALVTGAVGLLGRHHCGALAAAGASVVVSDLEADRCASFASELNDRRGGAEAVPLAFDVTDPNSIERAGEELFARFGRLDALVNNAAINDMVEAPDPSDREGTEASANPSRFELYPLELWNRSLGVGLTGTFLCCQKLGARMAAAGRGSIINIASTYGIVAPDQSLYLKPDGTQTFYKSPAYPAVKSAVIGLTRFLGAYWGRAGVRANCISPGGVENQQEPWFVESYAKRTPLGRMAQPEDLAGALVFLASDASRYMTGANLVVDGGWTAW
jgi:NAD(P)-dependent dehydrogenase (short-subunit alcohol dehydrogenase family)